MKGIHYVSTTLIVECTTVIPLEKSFFLSLESPLINLCFSVFLLSLPLYSYSHLLDVLIGPDNISPILIVLILILTFNPFSIYFFLLI